MPAAYGDESTVRERRSGRTRAVAANGEPPQPPFLSNRRDPGGGAFDSNARGLEDVPQRVTSGNDVSLRTPR